CSCSVVVFFNDTATTEIYTLSLHDALPISGGKEAVPEPGEGGGGAVEVGGRSEEHTSELQSHLNLVCRLLLEKKEDGTTENDHAITLAGPAVIGHPGAVA